MKTIHPYRNDAFNTIYSLLFCDDINLYQAQHKSPELYPWNILFSDTATAAELEKVIADTNTESRVKILACHKLPATGHTPAEKELLGVIIEVALQDGLDTLAAYKDGTARYINHTEKLIVWETKTKESGEIIAQLFRDSEIVVSRIGAWNKERLPPPLMGEVRLSFLVSGSLYFGQGTFEVLQKDAMGGPVISSGLALLQYLTAQKLKEE